MPTLDSALRCSSRVGSYLGRESGLVWGALSIGFPHSEPLLYISKHKQPFSLTILITHVCGSRDHINIEHAYSGYSLPKRDSIHWRRVKSVISSTAKTPLLDILYFCYLIFYRQFSSEKPCSQENCESKAWWISALFYPSQQEIKTFISLKIHILIWTHDPLFSKVDAKLQ